ncbi:MAG: Uma2 family endonuclease [Pseudomonadota bacterium]
MALTQPEPLISVEDYLEGELTSERRHEYIGGRVYAMTGTSVAHNLIALNLAVSLRSLARSVGCQVFVSDIKIRLRVAAEDIFYYPDVMLCCDPTESETYYRTRPCLIVEVLSKSTQRIDQREKLLSYITLPSLREYLLVMQNRREVLCHRRDNNWIAERITEGEVRLDCLDTAIPLEAIYEDVELTV